MDLIMTFIENLYKYGNVTITMLLNGIHLEYCFTIDENNKLNIRMKTHDDDYDDNDDYDDAEDQLITILSTLIESNLKIDEMIKRKIEFHTTKKELAPDSTILVINHIYRKILPLILINYDYIKKLIEDQNTYTMIVNSYKSNADAIEDECTVLSYDTIYQRLLRKTKTFRNTISKGAAYRADQFPPYKYRQFLAKLYIDQYIKKISNDNTIDLDTIDIDYEFLTDKFYQTDPSIGREDEIREVETTLLTPSKSSILVGPPGTGKTAIVEGLAHKIRTQQVPLVLKNKRILKVTTSSIVRGCTLVGQLEEKIEQIMKYLIENPNVILFIDEIHATIGAGTGNNSNLDLANMMKPYLDRGEIKVIGATTEDEYKKYISKDEAYRRRFIKTIVSVPNDTLLHSIISENILKFEKQTSINWEFNSSTTDYIINHLIACTKEKYRTYDDKRYNPDLVLLILEVTFASASRNDSKKITLEHLAEAIKSCSVLYPSAREKLVQELISTLSHTQEQHNTKSRKIIPFNPIKV